MNHESPPLWERLQHEALVWWSTPAAMGKSRDSLSNDEQIRADAYEVGPPRETFIAGRRLYRWALGAVTGVAPAAWRIQTDEKGKPHVHDAGEFSELQFNLSHTHGLIACIVARSPVGIDVENMRRPVDALALAREVFDKEEQQMLAELPEPGRSREFYELWVAREAILKARGRGIVDGMELHGPQTHDIRITLPADGFIAATATQRGIIGAVTWQRHT